MCRFPYMNNGVAEAREGQETRKGVRVEWVHVCQMLRTVASTATFIYKHLLLL